MKFSQLFNSKKTRLENDARRTLSSTTLKPGKVVRHRLTGHYGRVTFVGVMSGSLQIPIVSVDFDNGKVATQVPAEDFADLSVTR